MFNPIHIKQKLFQMLSITLLFLYVSVQSPLHELVKLPSLVSHFIEHKNNYPYDPLPNDKLYSKCNKFGEINFITGSIDYDLAKNCRDDNNKCGKNGSEYKEK